MSFFQKSVLVLLALSTLGAQTVCACPSTKKFQPAQPEAVRQNCTGKGKCCVQMQPLTPPSDSRKDWPCERCNLMHPADQIQPERQNTAAAAVAHHAWIAPAPAPLFLIGAIADQTALPCGAEHVSIPPLLHDLFHSGILLLI